MTKLNYILSRWKPGDVHTLRWLETQGIGQRTAYQYYQSSSLEKIGSGVFSRKGDELHWAGALRAMQEELGLKIHVGSYTLLSFHGSAHQLGFNRKIDLLTYSKARLPKWVLTNKWNQSILLVQSGIFKNNPELESIKIQGIKILASTRELAILEFINQVDLEYSFETIENQMENMRTLRSKNVQNLLENCTSVKVKRVFLYISESLNLPFFKKLDIGKIDLGSGKRIIVKGGVLDKKYLITIPGRKEGNPF